jgi:hypothetical protein
LLRWAVQSIAGVCGQLQAAIGGRSRTVKNLGSIAENHDLFPTCPPREVVIGVGELVNARNEIKPAAKYESDFHRKQTASALGKRRAPLYRFKLDGPSIALQRKACFQKWLLPIEVAVDAGVIWLWGNIELPNLLICGDFSHIHQIQDLNRLLADCDLRIVINAEISHRVGETCRRAQNQQE